MAKKNTIIIVGIVVAVLIVAGIGWITVGSDLVDSISGGGGGGSNQNTTQEDTNKPPTAILEAEPTFVREGEAVVFDGNESYDIDYTGTQSNNGIFFFEWNFGDGSEVLRVQNGTEKSYIYNEQG
ncbi:MAG: hypothetical protein U9R75_00285, partial [Candidatus Thermoplasmatota archaeon]|nr:hypothetical protein [Candidatus Thermoplasmatota archaeon]